MSLGVENLNSTKSPAAGDKLCWTRRFWKEEKKKTICVLTILIDFILVSFSSNGKWSIVGAEKFEIRAGIE
jgi:hypothetical protein